MASLTDTAPILIVESLSVQVVAEHVSTAPALALPAPEDQPLLNSAAACAHDVPNNSATAAAPSEEHAAIEADPAHQLLSTDSGMAGGAVAGPAKPHADAANASIQGAAEPRVDDAAAPPAGQRSVRYGLRYAAAYMFGTT